MNTHNYQKQSFRPIIREPGQVMWTIFSIALVCLVIFIGDRLFVSPLRLEPFVDETGSTIPGSISERIFIPINGVNQGMFIQSKDASQPVLLYLHGGMPDYFLTKIFPTGFEDIFTVVWWEQRGSGMSYSKDIPRNTITVEQLIADTHTVTNYLRQRFGKDKIYLMGHSGGTFIGIQAAVQAPELYYAYLGVEQITFQLQSELLAYEYMLQRFKDNGNNRMVAKLEAFPVTLDGGTPEGYLKLRDPAMHSLGIGTTHDMRSVITGIFLPSLMTSDYTLMEKVNLWRAKSQAGVSVIWDEMLTTDLTQQLPELTIPVYFFHGIYDYTCSYPLAKAYFENLRAPVKGFYTFENSAHSPMFEEPEKMQQILSKDILEGTNNLSD